MSDYVFDSIRKQFQKAAEKAAEQEKKEELQTEFESTDKKSIKKLTDSELARWQAKYPTGSPQAIFAEQLWKYRLAKHSAKFTAAISITSAIVGGILGYSIKTMENKITEKKTSIETEINQNKKPPVRQETSNNFSKLPKNTK